MNKNIGKRLKIVRIKLGFKTQSMFAERLGISQNALSKYESGTTELSDELKIKISRFGINIHWLVTGEGEIFIHKLPQNDVSIQEPKEAVDEASASSIEDHIANLASKIKEVRKKMGKSQKDLAELLGIPQTTWSNYEIGKAKPPLKILMQLADLGYAIPGFSNNVILGNNNTQIGNNNHIVQAPDNSSPQYPSDEYAELIELLCNYAPPKMLKELKAKLLKIKEMADDTI
ncbi:helix-turn-helix transcriptional regulator [Treponema sp. OMZ 805]|uniref:helix-turn-helix transcriptional regulator n=1 Tax=Treponema sp. OMZ 805 TaxID=2726068 RepID=UPI003D9054BD